MRTALPTGPGIYLGSGARGWAWAGNERSALVLGPSRSGKTSSLIVPHVLAAPGAVVSTSTKSDVLDQTARSRAESGWCAVYDPSGTVELPGGVHRVGWSPLVASREWDGALQTADAMVRASRARSPTARSSGADGHWTERAAALLGPLLHAAALEGTHMRTVLHWVDRHDGSEALEALASRCGEAAVPTDVLAGIVSTDAREQSGIWSTASGVLAAYRSSVALASTEPPYLDADAFCLGRHTLYICAAGARQELLAPLVVGMVTDVRDAAYRRARLGVRSPPVLLALDEVANIAPLPDLPAIVSEGAGQGLLTLACLQDLSQARARWGAQADAFLSLFGTSLVLPGIGDVRTLEDLSILAGEREVTSRSVGSTRGGAGPQLSTTDSVALRRRLPADVIGRGVQGWALAVDTRNHMGWVRLTPAHSSSPWRDVLDPGHRRRRSAERSAPVREGWGR